MCGIAGLVALDGAAVEADLLRRMAAALAHRGPDDLAVWIDPDRPAVGLAHARLIVIDPAGGRQPMADLDRPGRRALFNGEIYNHADLRRELAARGHHFASDHSDTEVLLPLYDELGPALVDRLRGMFAIAIYDGPARRLILARDRLGQKPLYWTRTRRHFAFASELKALMLLPDFDRRLDRGALHHYLSLGYVPAPQTIFSAAWKLPPATRMIVPLDRPADGPLPTPQRFWSLPSAHETTDLTTRNGAADGADDTTPDPVRSNSAGAADDADLPRLRNELSELLTDAVRLRLEADVPLGFFLSGGLDSSIIVALARLADPRRELRTFSVGFGDLRYDESPSAALMAEHVGARHTRLELPLGSLGEFLPRVAAMFDEPFADSSALPTWLLARETRRHVTVALSGDGGDELFGGYDRYRAVALAAMIDRAGPLRHLASALGGLLPGGDDLKSRRTRLRRLTAALGDSPLARYAAWVSPFHDGPVADLYSPGLRQALELDAPLDYLRRHLPDGPASRRAADDRPAELANELGRGPWAQLAAVTRLDAVTYLPEDVLTKVDRAAMAHGLEVRSPLLDQEVATWAMRLPPHLKFGRPLGSRFQKAFFRSTFADLLPPRILGRGKMGFGVPISAWLAGPEAEFMRRQFAAGPLLESGLVDGEVVHRYVAEHVAGRRDHGPRLYSLLVLDEFLRQSGAVVDS